MLVHAFIFDGRYAISYSTWTILHFLSLWYGERWVAYIRYYILEPVPLVDEGNGCGQSERQTSANTATLIALPSIKRRQYRLLHLILYFFGPIALLIWSATKWARNVIDSRGVN
jgi:hypothetical protein